MARAPAAKKMDGRRARAVRTNRAIVEAILDLIDRGDLDPTAQQVADRAGVALRSIRQHFESRDALFIAAAKAHEERAGEVAMVDGALPFERRVTAFVEGRARMLERSSAIRRSASLVEHRSSPVAAIVRAIMRRRRQELSAVFARELQVLPAAEKRRTLDALDWVTSGRAWDYARLELGLSVAETSRHVERLIRAALAPALAALARHRAPEELP
jgi:AcrR family transcriptional regulator